MSFAPLEDFVKKYQVGRAHNSKEIRLSIKESEELSIAIALILTSNNKYQNDIIELQNKLLEDKSEIKISGGSFT